MGCHNTLFPSTPDRVLLESLNMWQSSSQPIGWLEWELYGLVLLQFEWVICHKFYFCTSGSHLLRTFFWAVTCCLPDLVISQVCCCFIHSVWLIINSRFFWLTSKIRIFYILSFYMDNPSCMCDISLSFWFIIAFPARTHRPRAAKPTWGVTKSACKASLKWCSCTPLLLGDFRAKHPSSPSSRENGWRMAGKWLKTAWSQLLETIKQAGIWPPEFVLGGLAFFQANSLSLFVEKSSCWDQVKRVATTEMTIAEESSWSGNCSCRLSSHCNLLRPVPLTKFSSPKFHRWSVRTLIMRFCSQIISNNGLENWLMKLNTSTHFVSMVGEYLFFWGALGCAWTHRTHRTWEMARSHSLRD